MRHGDPLNHKRGPGSIFDFDRDIAGRVQISSARQGVNGGVAAVGLDLSGANVDLTGAGGEGRNGDRGHLDFRIEDDRLLRNFIGPYCRKALPHEAVLKTGDVFRVKVYERLIAGGPIGGELPLRLLKLGDLVRG